jgi:hypothetical protein
MSEMLNDPRRIARIFTAGDSGALYRVEMDGVTEIIPYDDHGSLWFLVRSPRYGDRRINGAHVEMVQYEAAPEASDVPF